MIPRLSGSPLTRFRARYSTHFMGWTPWFDVQCVTLRNEPDGRRTVELDGLLIQDDGHRNLEVEEERRTLDVMPFGDWS